MINSQLKMVGRQLESEEVRKVVFGEHGSENELRLQLTVIIIPVEFFLHTVMKMLMLM
jgi:hypothetical protein